MEAAVFKDFSKNKKINRYYRLTVQDVDEDRNPIGTAIVIQNPFTLKFTVNRSIFAEVNQGDFEIYNLAPDTYNRLFFDYYSFNRQWGDYDPKGGNPWRNRLVILEAGYYSLDDESIQDTETIFVGDMWSCYTERRGSNTITKINAIIGLRAINANSDLSLMNVSRDEILQRLSADMGLNLKIYSGENDKIIRPVIINGNSYANMQKYSNATAFIDNSDVKILALEDGTDGVVPLISDESGLLGVPKRENGLLSVDMVFEPRIVVGQIIEIKSRVAPMFNGQYKVYGLKHSGTISDATAGSVVTEIQMLVGSQLYGSFGVVKAKY